MKVTRKAGKIEALKVAAKGLGAAEGKVGWFESARYAEGQPVAGVAAVQEYGSVKMNIPPRLGMRGLARDKGTAWQKQVGEAARAVALGKIPPEAAMEAVCLMAEADLKRQVATVTQPPLSLLTLQARAERKAGGTVTGKTLGRLAGADRDQGPPNVSGVSTKPLVDSGLLLATITSQVTKK